MGLKTSLSEQPTVALATYNNRPSLPPDDRLLLHALLDRGADAAPVVWDDPATDWATYDAVVVRSCWDQHSRPGAFTNWAVSLEDIGTSVFNAPRTFQWNIHKSHLLSLHERGHQVVPTVVVPRGSTTDLTALLEAYGWSQAVVKPAISASAEDTWRTSLDSAADDRRRFETQRTSMDLVVQQYLPEITEGEWSLIFFGGQYSHAVRKCPAEGDFRVQTHFGGSARAELPPETIVETAADILRDIPGREDPLYARVDGVERNGTLVLIEMECIAPFLFLGEKSGAASRFGDVILSRISE